MTIKSILIPLCNILFVKKSKGDEYLNVLYIFLAPLFNGMIDKHSKQGTETAAGSDYGEDFCANVNRGIGVCSLPPASDMKSNRC